MNALIW